MATARKQATKTKGKKTSPKRPTHKPTPTRTRSSAPRRAAQAKAAVARAPKTALPTASKPTFASAKGAFGKVKEVSTQRAQLDKERAQVESELALMRSQLQEAPEMTGDEVDLNVYERERTLGLVYAYERRLEEINATLAAAKKGKYGICERCGTPIDPERLEIFPETRLCVSCKNIVEREQRMLRP